MVDECLSIGLGEITDGRNSVLGEPALAGDAPAGNHTGVERHRVAQENALPASHRENVS